MSVRRVGFSLALLLLATAGLRAAEPAAPAVDFVRDIKPLLSNTCFRCHGPDQDERKGGTDGLRFDTPEGAIADLGGYAAIVPGHPEKSELIKRINSTDPNELMPPASLNRKLTQKEIGLLTEWIRQGAHYARHWSYVKPVRPPLPKVKHSAWPKNEIDLFLLVRLEKEGLTPSPEADRHALIRRVSLDLTGLPPTLAEVREFVADKDPQAYEKLVDRLLARETYGENWAHMWLDLARYADSAGYADDPRRTIWAYRDYVIRSINSNKPFDQYTIEQIAGDLLPNPTPDQLIATAFHRNTLTNNEGGTNDEEFRNVAIVDRVNTTMAVWMGTTMACAQCHTHKYDPITQDEYFKFFAFFNSSEDADRADESPLYTFFTDDQNRQRDELQTQIAALETTLRTPTPELAAAQQKWDAEFPRDVRWLTLLPSVVESSAKRASQVGEDGTISIPTAAATETLTITAPAGLAALRGLRLEALTDDALPGKGPGHAGGNFVISRVSGTINPPATQTLSGRYVRIELPGKQKYLSLAEVQVFAGTENIAPGGVATQISTDFGGDAPRAIDGVTNGIYYEGNSVTHTAAADDAWWEVDLKTVRPINRIVLWNRTDSGTPERLQGYRVSVLGEKREVVWQNSPAGFPNPSAELPVGGPQPLTFNKALADFTQANFDPQHVLKNPDVAQNGWAIGGAIGVPHSLTLLTPAAIKIPAESTLSITIEQVSKFENHTLGRLRLSASDDARAEIWAQTPAPIVTILNTPAAERTPEQAAALGKYYQEIAPGLKPQRDQLAKVQKQLADLKGTTVPIMRDMAQKRTTKVQLRGNYLDVGHEVHEGTPAAFPPLPADMPKNRLALAQWLVDENNPLTARVIANRYWEQIFGIGIVSTSEDFGSQGDLPFHPELLDWLATDLMASKWDVKAFLRKLVTSAAYRQSSRVTPELEQRDPDNRLLARGPRFRLSAEMVRDQALFVSGLLSPKMYGPPVNPPQPTQGLNAAFGAAIDWQTSMGEDRYRRALYTTWRRSNPYPSMATFDAPNREVCTVRRIRTNTPLQALVTLNDPVQIEAAQAFARRIVKEGGATTPERIGWAFEVCLARPPHERELQRLEQLVTSALGELQATPAEAVKLATDPLGPLPEGTSAPELAAYTVLSNVLFNLDETLMKR